MTCVKTTLGANRLFPGKIRIYRRAHGWVRDGYLTGDAWSEHDFMLHGWKVQNINVEASHNRKIKLQSIRAGNLRLKRCLIPLNVALGTMVGIGEARNESVLNSSVNRWLALRSRLGRPFHWKQE